MDGFRHTARDEKGRYTHEFFWVDSTPNYGLLLETPVADDNGTGSGQFGAGELCYGCGKWLGEPLKRGEAKRFLRRQRTAV